MSNLAPVVSRFPVPGRALWWLGGAVAAGVAIPVTIGAVTALLAYYPVGSFLPRISLFSLLGSVLVIGATALIVVAVGIGHSILALNWRPLLLAIVTAGVMVPSVYPGMAVHLYLQKMAFGALAERSATLVEAIKRYKRDTGAPPDVLADLVPRYLAKIPHTGMSEYPEYRYTATPCSVGSTWSISIYVGFDTFVYCPEKDYPSRVEMIGDWGYVRD
jgi:hypothetical protein